MHVGANKREDVLEEIGTNGFSGRYVQFYYLLQHLSATFKEEVLRSGILRLLNEWNVATDFNEAINEIRKGMEEASPADNEVEEAFREFGLAS